MRIKGEIDVRSGLLSRMVANFESLREDWLDEAAEASVSGNPRRGFYLECLATGPDNLIDRRIHAARVAEQQEHDRRIRQLKTIRV